MCSDCSTKHGPWKDRKSVEHDLKLIRHAEYHDECIHQVWDQSPEQFVQKRGENSGPNKGQETTWIQRSMTKSLSGLRTTASLRSIPWAVCLEMRRNHRSVSDREMNEQTDSLFLWSSFSQFCWRETKMCWEPALRIGDIGGGQRWVVACRWEAQWSWAQQQMTN